MLVLLDVVVDALGMELGLELELLELLELELELGDQLRVTSSREGAIDGAEVECWQTDTVKCVCVCVCVYMNT